MKGSNTVFSPRGKSGLIKITVFMVLAGFTGQARILYLEERFPFSGRRSEVHSPAAKKPAISSLPPEVFIYVHIEGEIKTPGLYKMAAGSRLADIIKKSGGVSAAADISDFNLARRLKDGEKVVIPRRRGFFSRLGIGSSPPPAYIIPPEEKIEIEVIRKKR